VNSDESTKVDFLPQLKLLCARHGLRQSDIAEIAGVSKAAASKWFNGAPLKVESAAAIARYFRMTIDQLAGLPDTLAEARERSASMIQESAEIAKRYDTERERDLAFHASLAEKQCDEYRTRLEQSEKERNALLDTLFDVHAQISSVLKDRPKPHAKDVLKAKGVKK